MTNPTTALTINVKKLPLGSFVKPNAEINGHALSLNWGRNEIPAFPGVHHIHIYMPWIWRFGKADITVDNRTAPAPEVFYAPPFINFINGAIGFQPVKNPGLLGMLAVIGVPFLLIALCCALGTILDS
ncbi:hypothetical protein GCM10009682_26050 [Luedemannella flava]|uniref:Uncharacterized protein n=1 Tax=Luedemannella flava TaxID=349316 RepID=A0ABN2LY36_9ACTN